MSRLIRFVPAIAAAGVILLPPSARAAESETTIRIVAVVQPFCRISMASGEDGATVEGGIAHFGAVREVCNTPSGYTVRAQFQNLRSGTLRAGDALLPISPDGSVSFGSGMARLRTRDWSVLDIDPASQPKVYMRLSISPL